MHVFLSYLCFDKQYQNISNINVVSPHIWQRQRTSIYWFQLLNSPNDSVYEEIFLECPMICLHKLKLKWYQCNAILIHTIFNHIAVIIHWPIKSAQIGPADFNHFLLQRVNRFINKVINAISLVIYALITARFRVQYGQYFPSFSYFADLFHEPLGEWNKSKIWEARKILVILCEINVR